MVVLVPSFPEGSLLCRSVGILPDCRHAAVQLQGVGGGPFPSTMQTAAQKTAKKKKNVQMITKAVLLLKEAH
jgi:hypothetical protein